jgi:hypothetical protein
MCVCCFDEVAELRDSGCNENPEDLHKAPIGMYHCPECGVMLIAGMPHPRLCVECVEKNH